MASIGHAGDVRIDTAVGVSITTFDRGFSSAANTVGAVEIVLTGRRAGGTEASLHDTIGAPVATHVAANTKVVFTGSAADGAARGLLVGVAAARHRGEVVGARRDRDLTDALRIVGFDGVHALGGGRAGIYRSRPLAGGRLAAGAADEEVAVGGSSATDIR